MEIKRNYRQVAPYFFNCHITNWGAYKNNSWDLKRNFVTKNPKTLSKVFLGVYNGKVSKKNGIQELLGVFKSDLLEVETKDAPKRSRWNELIVYPCLNHFSPPFFSGVFINSQKFWGGSIGVF